MRITRIWAGPLVISILFAAAVARGGPPAKREAARGTGLPAVALPTTLPPEAESVRTAFEQTKRKVLDQAQAKLVPHRTRAIKRLQALQDKYCRAAKLDQALAIRRYLRQLKNIRADPGYLRATTQEIGKTYRFTVTGSVAGSIWGTKIYTSDSHLATAAVHAGVLKAGESGTVSVKILPGRAEYVSSRRHGITSTSYGAWGVSFSVGRAKF